MHSVSTAVHSVIHSPGRPYQVDRGVPVDVEESVDVSDPGVVVDPVDVVDPGDIIDPVDVPDAVPATPELGRSSGAVASLGGRSCPDMTTWESVSVSAVITAR